MAKGDAATAQFTATGIRDSQIRHKIGIQRHGSEIVNKAVPFLDDGDQKIIDFLASHPDALQGNFRWVLRRIQQINSAAYDAYQSELEDWLKETAAYEVDYQGRMLQFLTGEKPALPNLSDVWSRARKTPTFANLLDDVIQGQEERKLNVIRQALQRGLASGDSMDDIIGTLRGTALANYRNGLLSTVRSAAERLTRTLVNQVASTVADMLFGGNADSFGGVQWVAVLDTATCFACMSRDGKIYPANSGERPPLHFNCRCMVIPVVPGSAAPTGRFDSWLRGQSAAVQDEALGPTRGKLFRLGKLPIDRFVDVRGNELTLDQLRNKDAGAFERAGLEQ